MSAGSEAFGCLLGSVPAEDVEATPASGAIEVTGERRSRFVPRGACGRALVRRDHELVEGGCDGDHGVDMLA